MALLWKGRTGTKREKASVVKAREYAYANGCCVSRGKGDEGSSQPFVMALAQGGEGGRGVRAWLYPTRKELLGSAIEHRPVPFPRAVRNPQLVWLSRETPREKK